MNAAQLVAIVKFSEDPAQLEQATDVDLLAGMAAGLWSALEAHQDQEGTPNYIRIEAAYDRLIEWGSQCVESPFDFTETPLYALLAYDGSADELARFADFQINGEREHTVSSAEVIAAINGGPFFDPRYALLG